MRLSTSASAASTSPRWKLIRTLLARRLKTRADRRRLIRPRLTTDTPPTTLHDLPVEILEEIFEQACTDGGKTACALSLVSVSINAASRAARFHSASLLSGLPAQIEAARHALLRAQEAASAAGSTLPRVRHLALSLAAFPKTWWAPSRLALALQARMQALKTRGSPSEEAWRAFFLALATTYHDAVAKFLLEVAPDIKTILLFGPRSAIAQEPLGPVVSPSPLLVTGGFPRLRDASHTGDSLTVRE